MWQWLFNLLSVIQRQLQPVSARAMRINVPLRVVVLGGSEVDFGLAQSGMLDVQRWYRDKVGILWRVEWKHRPGYVVGERELRAHNAEIGDPVPTLYVLSQQDRLERQGRGAWAGTYGYTIADPNPRLVAHELGHALGLGHKRGTFMDARTEGRRMGRVTAAQRETMRSEALFYE